MSTTVEYLDCDDLLELAGKLLGSPPPVRDLGLLEAAAARPQTSVFGEDAYPNIEDKAVALMHSIVKNHPLVDGNKRLGWLAAGVFLELNEASVAAADCGDVYNLMLAVASGEAGAEEASVRVAGFRKAIINGLQDARRSLRQ